MHIRLPVDAVNGGVCEMGGGIRSLLDGRQIELGLDKLRRMVFQAIVPLLIVGCSLSGAAFMVKKTQMYYCNGKVNWHHPFHSPNDMDSTNGMNCS